MSSAAVELAKGGGKLGVEAIKQKALGMSPPKKRGFVKKSMKNMSLGEKNRYKRKLAKYKRRVAKKKAAKKRQRELEAQMSAAADEQEKQKMAEEIAKIK